MIARRRIKTVSNDIVGLIKNVAKAQHIIDIISSNCSKILFFSGGNNTSYVLSYCVVPDHCIIRVCDSYKQGSIFDYKIERVSQEILNWADVILISNFYNRKEIYNLLKEYNSSEKSVQLYDENDVMPYYLSEVDLDAQSIKLCSKEKYGYNKYYMWNNESSGVVYENNVEKDFFYSVTVNYYLKYINKNDKVLDIGAGTGRLSLAVRNYGCNVTAVDTSKSMLRHISEKASDIKTIIVDSEVLPLESESFDVVVSCDAMIHFLNWKQFLLEHCRVLKKGGYIVYNLYNADHLMRISDDERISSSYIAGGEDYYATVTKEELQKTCKEFQLELVEMIPCGFFVQSACTYGIFTREEMFNFGKMYTSLCRNKEAKSVITKFENDIVSRLSPDSTAINICVMKKI